MASSTSAYSFTDEEVSHLANCNDQAEFLHFFQRLLQSKSIDLTAVFDAQTTLGSSTDYGASVLTRFFETQSHALHLAVGYALFQPCSSSSCLKLGPALLPASWLKKYGADSFLILPFWLIYLFLRRPGSISMPFAPHRRVLYRLLLRLLYLLPSRIFFSAACLPSSSDIDFLRRASTIFK